MRKQLTTALAALLLFAAGASAQTSSQTRPDDESASHASRFSPVLVGSWKSAPDEMRLTTDFDKSVWGADATSVRTIDLSVDASGEAKRAGSTCGPPA